MGIFDFLAKRKEEKERARQKAAQREKERRAAERIKREERARSREEKRKLREAARREKRELKKKVAYERIFFWIESRIGIISDLDDSEVKERLAQLLADERKKGTAPRLHGNMDYDPYAGLEAYIRTNSYRRMLEDHASSEAGMIGERGEGADGEDASGKEMGNGKMEHIPPSGPRYRELTSMHPSYGRLQYWIEQRIGNVGDLDDQELHARLLELVEEERKGNPPRIGKKGKMIDPTAGLEAYVRSKAYLRMLR